MDWAALLGGIADAFDGIASRLDTLEARVDALDGNKAKSNDFETEVLDLPRWLAPKHGVAIGIDDQAGIRFSPPLMTKKAKRQ